MKNVYLCMFIVYVLYCLLIEVVKCMIKKGLYCCLLIGRYVERRLLSFFGFFDVGARGGGGVGGEIYINSFRVYILVLRDVFCSYIGKSLEWRVVILKEDL